MKNVAEQIRQMPNPLFGKGCTMEEIHSAEELLELSFADDYRQYLLDVGIAAAGGREFTGIGSELRTHVVAVTECNRNCGSETLKTMYVVEEAGYDGIVAWQNSNGEIFENIFGSEPLKVADSFAEYLKI